MRIGFAGTPEVALPALDALVASDHEVAAVITRPDAPAGRGKKLTASPVAQRAAQLGIEVVKPGHPRDPEFGQWLDQAGLDAVAVVAYGALLPQSVLDQVRGGWINLHFSLLPSWRGAAPLQRAIWAGDAVTGTTTFRIVKALDAGPVFRQVKVPIGDWDTAGTLFEELSSVGATSLVDTMDAIQAGESPTDQGDQISLAAKISVADAQIDFTAPAEQVSRQIRATTPFPGAWAMLGPDRFKVAQIGPASETLDLAPGQLWAGRRELLVGTGTSPLQLARVQAAGKKAMAGADWARGAALDDQARLT